MRFYLLLILVVLLIGCATQNKLESNPTPTEVALVSPTAVPTSAPTTKPTETASPTPAPTKTVRPTFTVIPTNTPRPTAKPTKKVRPTATPLPAVITPTLAVETSESTQAAATLPPTAEATLTPIPTRTPIPTESAASSTTDTTDSADSSQPDQPVAPETLYTTIGALANLSDGTKATISGNVILATSFSKGFQLTLSDGTGQVILLLWHNVYDQLGQRAGLNVGSAVNVNGEVGRYNGQLQIEPRSVGDVTVTQTAGAWGQAKQVSELWGAINQRAMVDGTITRANVYDNGTKIILNDGTGDVELFIWSNIYQRMPNQGALTTVGGKLRAVGIVSEYNGKIQLQPALPYDVIFNP